VAVKSGRCIAHGAKKKGCNHIDCEKQAIFGGMCKRHYDEANGVVKTRSFEKNGEDVTWDDVCTVVNDDPEEKGSGHRRGLSIFHDDDLMNTIINNGAPSAPPTPPAENDGLHGLSIF
jgi:hypothetical protein